MRGRISSGLIGAANNLFKVLVFASGFPRAAIVQEGERVACREPRIKIPRRRRPAFRTHERAPRGLARLPGNFEVSHGTLSNPDDADHASQKETAINMPKRDVVRFSYRPASAPDANCNA